MIFLNKRATLVRRARRHFAKSVEVQLEVKVAAVADDRAVLHHFKMLFVDNVAVAGHRDKEIADLCGFLHRQHAEAVHNGLDRLDRIDLGDNDVRTHTAGTHRNAFTAPAVADDDQRFAGKQDIGRTNDAVERRLARAVAIIKEMLGLSVVDRDGREG